MPAKQVLWLGRDLAPFLPSEHTCMEIMYYYLNLRGGLVVVRRESIEDLGIQFLRLSASGGLCRLVGTLSLVDAR